MPIAKCARCEAMFHRVKTPVCLACLPDEEKDHDTICDAVGTDPSLTVARLVEMTGITEACINRMLDAGLIANVSLATEYKCGRCGAPAISASKKLCRSCLGKLEQDIVKTRAELRTSLSAGGTDISSMVEKKRK